MDTVWSIVETFASIISFQMANLYFFSF